MFENVAQQVNQMLDRKCDAIVEHLCCGQNKIKIQIKIQSPEDVSLIIETFTKVRLANLSSSRTRVAEGRKGMLDSSYPRDGFSSKFNVEKYKIEIYQAVEHYVTSCRFYSLPLVLNIFITSDNSITGNLISNFIFKDN